MYGIGLQVEKNVQQSIAGTSDVNMWADVRVATNGGYIDPGPTRRAADRFIHELRNNDMFNRLYRVNLFCGTNLASCLVPIIPGTGFEVDVNNNFIESNYHQTNGLVGDGITTFLDTGWHDYATNGGYSAYILTPIPTNGTYAIIGARGGNHEYFIRRAPTSMGPRWGGLSGAGAAGALNIPKFTIGFRSRTNLIVATENGMALANFTGNIFPSNISFNTYVFGENVNGTNSFPLESTVRLAGYGINNGLFVTNVDTIIMFNIWQNFQTGLGRNFPYP